jgi:DNA invertase Pin-like site-specific DNA recombinase
MTNTPSSGRRVAIYTRVSTDDQTTETQRRELLAVAERYGWNVVAEFTDQGISGTKGRDKRPGLDAMLKAITRREIDVVAAWSVDRLGRSLPDLVGILGDINAAGVNLYLHAQAVNTTTPAGRAVFGMMSVFAQFERAMIVERVNAGIARARAKGTRSGRPFGRPRVDAKTEAAIREALMASDRPGLRKIATTFQVGNGTVERIARELKAAYRLI